MADEQPDNTTGSATPDGSEPIAEEPVAEEPVAEEPVAEEPVAEEPVAEDLVAEEPVVPAGPTRPSSKRLIAAGLGALVLLVAIVGGTFYAIKYRDQNRLNNALEQARLQGCDFAKALISYDFNHLDAYFQSVNDATTGGFQQYFEQNGRSLKKGIIDDQVKSVADHVECGVRSGDQNKVIVIAAVDQVISSTMTQGQQASGMPIGLVLTESKIDNQWKVSDLVAPGLIQ